MTEVFELISGISQQHNLFLNRKKKVFFNNLFKVSEIHIFADTIRTKPFINI